MELQEMYILIGGDYEDAMARLMKEERLRKFLGMFLQSGEYDNMITAYEDKDYERLFRESHSLKGMAANLSLSSLFTAVSDVCESVRHGAPETDISDLIEKAKFEYKRTTDGIKEALS